MTSHKCKHRRTQPIPYAPDLCQAAQCQTCGNIAWIRLHSDEKPDYQLAIPA